MVTLLEVRFLVESDIWVNFYNKTWNMRRQALLFDPPSYVWIERWLRFTWNNANPKAFIVIFHVNSLSDVEGNKLLMTIKKWILKIANNVLYHFLLINLYTCRVSQYPWKNVIWKSCLFLSSCHNLFTTSTDFHSLNFYRFNWKWYWKSLEFYKNTKQIFFR